MNTDLNDLLVDTFERVRTATRRAVEGLDTAALTFRLDGEANTIAWLVWHIARIQDDHIAGLHADEQAPAEQVWNTGWYERFAVPFDRSDTGYGHSNDDVAAVRAGAADLLGYLDAVHEATIAYVQRISAGDLDRVVDRTWDPPVTLGVRLVSVAADNLQHAGQAAFIRGLALRSSS
jgi:hypothetical protein